MLRLLIDQKNKESTINKQARKITMPLQDLTSNQLVQLAVGVTEGRIDLTSEALHILTKYCTHPDNMGHPNIAEAIRKTDNPAKGTPGHRPAQAALLAMVKVMKLSLARAWLAAGGKATTNIDVEGTLTTPMKQVWNAFIAISNKQEASPDRQKSNALSDLTGSMAGSAVSSVIDFFIDEKQMDLKTAQTMATDYASALNTTPVKTALATPFAIEAAAAAQLTLEEAITRSVQLQAAAAQAEAKQAVADPVAQAEAVLKRVEQTLTPLKERVQSRGFWRRAAQTASGGTNTGRASLRVRRAAKSLTNALKRYNNGATPHNLRKLEAALAQLELRLKQAKQQVTTNTNKASSSSSSDHSDEEATTKQQNSSSGSKEQDDIREVLALSQLIAKQSGAGRRTNSSPDTTKTSTPRSRSSSASSASSLFSGHASPAAAAAATQAKERRPATVADLLLRLQSDVSGGYGQELAAINDAATTTVVLDAVELLHEQYRDQVMPGSAVQGIINGGFTNTAYDSLSHENKEAVLQTLADSAQALMLLVVNDSFGAS